VKESTAKKEWKSAQKMSGRLCEPNSHTPLNANEAEADEEQESIDKIIAEYEGEKKPYDYTSSIGQIEQATEIDPYDIL